MTKSRHCAENERIKRRYLQWLKDARGYSTPSVDMAAAALSRFEAYTGYRDFKRFHVEQARAFKSHLSGKALGVQSGAPLSKATVTSTLRNLRAFFIWLADQPGYRSRIKHSDAEYFTPLGHAVSQPRQPRQRSTCGSAWASGSVPSSTCFISTMRPRGVSIS